MSDKISLSAQATAVDLMIARGVIRKITTRHVEAELLETQLQAAANTLRWMQANEAEIRAAVRK